MWVEGWGVLPGQLVVVSGPSGSGKSTLVRRACERLAEGVVLSVSATSRPPRLGEREGIDYYFLSRADFLAEVAAEHFLETAEFNGNFYGTPARPVREAVAAGRSVILEIEVQGALQVRRRAPTALFVFVDAPEFNDLERRLRARGTEDEATIHRRLVRAREERAEAHWYDERIINDDLDAAVDRLVALLTPGPRGG